MLLSTAMYKRSIAAALSSIFYECLKVAVHKCISNERKREREREREREGGETYAEKESEHIR